MSVMEGVIRSRLDTLWNFGVFDHLAYRVDGDAVTLSGEVVAPDLKFDAEAAMFTTPGVYEVRNQIRVLTVTPAENETRKAVFFAIYSDRWLTPFVLTPGGTIHIVVEGGRVTLEGEVSGRSDAQRAVALAQSAPGVSTVVDHLSVCW
jgi:hypothetical protein